MDRTSGGPEVRPARDAVKRFPFPNPALVGGLLVPTALAAVLVLYDLGSRSLWLDEGVTFTTASQHGPRLLQAALNDGGNMLSYYVGMHYWLALFGSSEFSMRLPTAIAAIGTVPVCFGILVLLFDGRAATFGAFFVAVSLPFVWYAQDARAYLVAMFLVCGAMLTFVVAVQNGHRLAWAAYVGLTVLSVYTVVLSALVVLVHAVCLLLRRRDQRWTSSAVAVGAMGLLVVPLGWVVADHGAQPIKWLPPPGPLFGATDRYLVEFFASARTDGAPFSNWTVDLLTLGMLLCWAVGLCLFLGSLARRRLATEPWGYGLLLAWFLLPPVITYLISVGIQPVLSDRYILTALPPASMIAGVALSRLRPWPVAVAPALIILALRAWVLVPGYGVPLENWRQGVIDVASRSQPHDCIAFFVADGYTAFDYYVLHLRSLPGPVPTPVLPRSSWLSRTPYALDPEAVPPSQMSQVVSSCPRLWLVSSHDLGSPPGPGVLPYRVRVYDAHKKLRAEVGAAYRQSAAWSFLGADVSLYVRRPQYDPHASPVRG